MEAVCSLVVGKLTEFTLGSTANQIGYLFHYKTNVENLKNRVDNLKMARERIQHSVDAAMRNGEEIEADVKHWIEKVSTIVEEAEKFFIVEGEAKTRCSGWSCPNFWLRHKLSRKAKKMVLEFVDVELKKFEKVSYCRPVQAMWIEPNRDYETLESRKSTVNEIMRALVDLDTGKVGVWGMAGVGKTTTAKEVARQAEGNNLFDKVVIVGVTPNPDIRRIQNDIAEMLDMKLVWDNIAVRAHHLSERIKKEDKVLVILDDMWSELDMREVGIPHGDDHKGCKILGTSRNEDVLSSMDFQAKFQLEIWLEEETWKLFTKMAGDLNKDPDLKPIAIEVAKRCAGLPLLIVTVSRALKNKNLAAWKDALRRLRRLDNEGMHAKVYSALELSYNHLEGTSVLLKIQRNRVETLVETLKSCCLLVDTDIFLRVQMHDLIHDFAVMIASRDWNAYSTANDPELKEWKHKDTLKECQFMTFPYGTLRDLQESFECPELKFFSLCSEHRSYNIPDNLFEGMRKLQVSDLVGLSFPLLPSSIRSPDHLQALCLDYCVLEDISVIGYLKSLEVLSLVHSQIKELPMEVGQLARLRLLDLTGSTLQVIPANVISSLINLEELYMGGCFFEWESKAADNEGKSANLAELRYLSCLTSLEICINDAGILLQDMFSEKLERFWIRIGPWKWSAAKSTSSLLKFKTTTGIILDDGLKRLVNKAEELTLDGLAGVKGIAFDLDEEGLRRLKRLIVQNSSELLYLVNSMERILCRTFPMLESLFVSNMITLEKIINGKLAADSFGKMKTLTVKRCDRLKNLFSISFAKAFAHLREIEVRYCKMLEGIFGEEGVDVEAATKIRFGQLHTLRLWNLPCLAGFLPEMKTSSTFQSSFDERHITDLLTGDGPNNFMPLFDERVECPCLETLDIKLLDKCKMIWDNHAAAYSFGELKTMEINACKNLVKIFPSNMLGSLPSLQILKIKDCDSLEEVFDLSSPPARETSEILATRLRHLRLCGLPKLKHVWSNDPQGILAFQNLQMFFVQECKSLKTLLPASIAKDLQKLETLDIKDSGLKNIVGKEESLELEAPGFVFSQLTSLTLEGLHELKSLYPGVHTSEWPSLKDLTVCKCDRLKIFNSNISNFTKRKRPTQRHSHEPILLPLFLTGKATFENLRTLRVADCNGLSSLLTFSMAKSLNQLTRMSISGCKSLTTVVDDDGIEEDDEIVFDKLQYLGIFKSERLKSFHPGKCSMTFSCLERLVLDDCFRMKTFSNGALSTPMLRVVTLSFIDDHWKWWIGVASRGSTYWEGDVNSTIRKLWGEEDYSGMAEAFTYILNRPPRNHNTS